MFGLLVVNFFPGFPLSLDFFFLFSSATQLKHPLSTQLNRLAHNAYSMFYSSAASDTVLGLIPHACS